ncbi:MAG: LptF/LptG family permease [Saprospiraceae bacterium]
MKNPFKIIDVYVIKSFVAPFVLWTLIALFVLLLQMMWVYIDEIMGKGAGLFFITEMIFYLSVFLVPQAMLIGVLTASVMSVGGLAENYELSSMKSAGVSVLRIFRPIVLFCCLVGLFSYICSDFLSPLAKLKYNARLYDIRRQKPALAIDEGVFSDNFAGYTIRIGKKNNDGRQISDVMIYQASKQAANGTSTLSEVLAKNGEMYASDDEKYMIMHLKEGRRYEKAGSDEEHRFTFIRTSFAEWTKIFEVDALERTDERLFGNNQATKTVARLRTDIDSIGKYLTVKKSEFGKIYYSNFSRVDKSKDSSKTKFEVDINRNTIRNQSKYRITVPLDSSNQMVQHFDKALPEMGSILYTFSPKEQHMLLSRAKGNAEGILTQTTSNIKAFDKIRESQAKHICELNTKFLLSVMCVIFIFVGAPMGAIVRKGGFGFPVLIAISLFILYIFCYIMFRKLGEQGSINAWLAVWMPGLLMSAIGVFLTWHANNDRPVFNSQRWKFISKALKWLRNLISRLVPKKKKQTLSS